MIYGHHDLERPVCGRPVEMDLFFVELHRERPVRDVDAVLLQSAEVNGLESGDFRGPAPGGRIGGKVQIAVVRLDEPRVGEDNIFPRPARLEQCLHRLFHLVGGTVEKIAADLGIPVGPVLIGIAAGRDDHVVARPGFQRRIVKRLASAEGTETAVGAGNINGVGDQEDGAVALRAVAVFEGIAHEVVFIAETAVNVAVLVGGTETAAAGRDAAERALEPVEINTDVHFASLDLDAVVVGIGEKIAVDVGIAAETAVDEAVAAGFDSVVPSPAVAADEVVVTEHGAAQSPVHADRRGAGGMGIKPAVGGGMRRMDETPFDQVARTAVQNDAAVIVDHLAADCPAAELLQVTDALAAAEIADVAVPDHYVGTMVEINRMTASVGIDGEAVENDVLRIATVDHAAGEVFSAFQHETGLGFVECVSVGPSGNDAGKIPFEISLVEHDRFADPEIGTAGAECARYLGFRLAGDDRLELVIGIFLQQHDGAAPRVFTFHIHRIEDVFPVCGAFFPVIDFYAALFSAFRRGAVDVTGTVLKGRDQQKASGADRQAGPGFRIGVNIGQIVLAAGDTRGWFRRRCARQIQPGNQPGQQKQ